MWSEYYYPYHSPALGLWPHTLYTPVTDCYHGYPLVVTLVSYDSVTTFRLHLQHTGVRATSLACLLGLGLGLGSLLLYRLCRRLFGHPSSSPCTDRPPSDLPLTAGVGHLQGQEGRGRSASHASSSLDQPSPDASSDSGVSTMGNYQSDTSAAVSPESSFPSVLYNSSGSVRFRGFRKADDRLLEEERNPLMRASSNGHHHSDDDEEESDEEDDDDDDETQGLLSGRRKPKRSPASMRRQLTIDIPLDESSPIHYQRGLSTPGSDVGSDGTLQRDVSFDGQSVGGLSLMPNFSPTSLHEKNLRLVDDDVPQSPSIETVSSGASGSGNCGQKDKACKRLSVDLELESSRSRGSVSELTSCTLHPLQTGDSPVSTNESESSKLCGGSGDSHTQSEYLSSEPRSRSLSPEVMTILSKYRNSFDSSGSVSPECIKRSASRRSTERAVKLSSSEPGKHDIDDWLDRRRHCLKHSSSSVSSATSSVDMSSRDLTLRARSLDFSDNPSGMATPDSDLFNPGDVGLKTAASMEQIQKELVNIEQEIADMSSKCRILSSRENLHMAVDSSSARGDAALANVLRVLVRHRSRDEAALGMTRSLSACDEGDEAQASAAETDDFSDSRLWRHSYHHAGQYVWDYQSDIDSSKTPPTRRRFVDHWGTLDESGESPQHYNRSRSQSHSRDHSRTQSPSFEHILSHLRQSVDSSIESDVPQTSSLADLYIDDDLSGLVSGDTKLHVDGLLQATAATNSDVTSLDSVDSVTSCDANLGHSNAAAHEYTRLGAAEEEDTNTGIAYTGSGPNGLPTNAGERGRSREGSTSTMQHQQPCDGKESIGPRVNILTYAKNEWRGDTDKARAILQGYEELEAKHGFSSVRVVRGDNYCAPRAVLYQALRTGVPLLQHLGPRDHLLQKLNIFTDSEYKYLQENWTFAGRLSKRKCLSVLETAKRCINTLYAKTEQLSAAPTPEERELLTDLVFNQQTEGEEEDEAELVDVLLMEAVKLLLLLAARELLVLRDAGRPLPTFAELLFARDTSSTLQLFVRNHLNGVGDSGGLEQIEMFLLSYALGLRVRVYRPSQYSQSDFCTTFADDDDVDTNGDVIKPQPTVDLVAEDDRHYNVLL